jgi:flagellar basal body-associated protein FliL
MLKKMMSNYKPIITYELMNEFQSYYDGEKGKKRVYNALITYKSSEKDDNNEINYQYASIVCNSSDGYDNLPVINTIMR